MGIILGIDIGGSTTKIVGTDGTGIIGMLQVKAADQVSSMYGALGKFLRTCRLVPADVSGIYLTGVGASYIDEQVFGIETHKIPEFDAIGTGALRLSKLSKALAVSIGTGTAFIRASSGENIHIGGTGIGGGTILGLASRLPCVSRFPGMLDIDGILSLAENGSLKNVDLMVGDIMKDGIDTLDLNLTASNFGKLSSMTTDSDIVLGIINMVFETIGVMALFALRNDTIDDVVLTGALAALPQAKAVFKGIGKMGGKNFIILPDAVYATALGTLPYDITV